MTELASHLGVFLREHLPRDRNASRHTVQSYADSCAPRRRGEEVTMN